MKKLCEYLGGSHLYSLNGPDSDEDIRGIFINTDPSLIVGLDRFDESRSKDLQIEDVIFKELLHFFRLLKKSNTEALEVLFAPIKAFSLLSPEFQKIRDNAHKFIDSEKLVECLLGYIENERRLALGIRKGKIGGKRYAQVKKYGFSPKNFTQLFRLAYLGIRFFEYGKFTVDCRLDSDEFNFLTNVKFHPENFSKEELRDKSLWLEERLRETYENKIVIYEFDKDLANQLILELYSPYLKLS